MKHIFKVNNSIILKDILNIVLLLLGIPFIFLLDETKFYIIGIPLIIWYLIENIRNSLLPNLSHRINIDNTKLEVLYKKDKIEIKWIDIKYVEFNLSKKEQKVSITTEEDSWEISLKEFSQEEIIQIIKDNVPESALREDAYKELESYKEWKEESKRLVSSTGNKIIIKDSKTFKVVGWISIIVFLIFTIGSYLSGETIFSLFFVPFIFLGIIILINSGATFIDGATITRKSMIREYRINWSEVNLIEISPTADTFVFKGNNKRLVIPGPMYWGEDNQDEIYNMLFAQIEERNIETMENKWAGVKLSKNCRIK